MAPMKIAIVGAGPVGLTLARLLSDKTNVEVVVFESERSRDARGQGGTLDLHPTTGLAALKEAGLYDEFLKRARFDGEALTICDKHLIKYVNLPGVEENSSRGRPEIDRYLLREMLLDSVLEGVIRWGCRLRSIDEKRNLIFDYGTESGFDLVVGADGAWSKIRKLISDQMPNYSGLTGISWTIPDAKEKAPECYKLVNRGSLYSYSDSRGIFSQQLGDGSLNVYTISPRPEDSQMSVPSHLDNVEAVRNALLEEFYEWDPRLLNILRHAQDPVLRPLYMLPVGWSWKNYPGVTIIGDAAHVMTPFAGEGVNLGMQDALMLSRAIITASNSPDPEASLPGEIQTFEKDLFVRAKETAGLTNDMMTWMFFTDGSPRSVIEKVGLRITTFHDKGLLSTFMYPFYAAAVYMYYAMFKLWHR
ncbi:hypothetical protein N7532_008341 [Penicillium argentinense]|uniref:FAD-binding domain-containing protein n=1 Tax=Penicillium argentinense TaxID=1131581 RepID=A0A9W9K2F1_9EURO|nr:uncharacterized protein N7532_008341 [Penicillium argentinense]KAJ5089657.1 hypothetical protein N7532_008341 [Penicillium argentinense]